MTAGDLAKLLNDLSIMGKEQDGKLDEILANMVILEQIGSRLLECEFKLSQVELWIREHSKHSKDFGA